MNGLTVNNFDPNPGCVTDLPARQDLLHPGAGNETPWLDPSAQRAPALAQLRCIFLLGGSIATSSFQTAIRRSAFDLPVQAERTILQCWQDQCASLAQGAGLKDLPVRLILDRSAPLPVDVPSTDSAVAITIERDPVELRGTGGLLRDLTAGYANDDYVLVANALQLLRAPLPVLAADLAGLEASVVVISHADGTPSGVMLVRCKCLRDLPAIGFVDMKEQGLGIIARRHEVKVLEKERPTGLPVRTNVSYISALRQHHQDLLAVSPDRRASRFEDWEGAFAIVEGGAEVAPTARIHDSVVLRGAKVEARAVVINSVVCDGAIIPRGQIITDELVQPRRRR